MLSFHYQEDQIERLCLTLAKCLPNLENLLEGVEPILNGTSSPNTFSSRSLESIVSKLIQLTRSTLYEYYQIDLKDIIVLKLQQESYTITNSFSLVIVFYILIDRYLLDCTLQNRAIPQILIADFWTKESYSIQVIYPATNCFEEDTISNIQERLSSLRATVKFSIDAEQQIWLFSFPNLY